MDSATSISGHQPTWLWLCAGDWDWHWSLKTASLLRITGLLPDQVSYIILFPWWKWRQSVLTGWYRYSLCIWICLCCMQCFSQNVNPWTFEQHSLSTATVSHTTLVLNKKPTLQQTKCTDGLRLIEFADLAMIPAVTKLLVERTIAWISESVVTVQMTDGNAYRARAKL